MAPHGKQGKRVPGKGHDADLEAHPSLGIDLGDHVSRRPARGAGGGSALHRPHQGAACGRTGASWFGPSGQPSDRAARMIGISCTTSPWIGFQTR